MESIALKFTDDIQRVTPSQDFCGLLQSMIQGRIISVHVICNTPLAFPFTALAMLGKVDSVVIEEPIRRDPGAHASRHEFPRPAMDAYILLHLLRSTRFETRALDIGCAIVTDITDLDILVIAFPKLTTLRLWVGYSISAYGISQTLLPLQTTLEVLDIQRERICNPENLLPTDPAFFCEFKALRTLRVHSNMWLNRDSYAQGLSATSPKDFIWNLEDDNRSTISQYLSPNLQELEMTLNYPHMLFARGKPRHMKFEHLPVSEPEKGFE